MKLRIAKITAALLLCLSLITGSALASALGSASSARTDTLSQGGCQLVTTSFTGARAQSEHYITYKPGSDVRPVIAYGNELYGRSTLSYVSSWVRSQNLAAAGGINASFFELDTGLPTGSEVTNGILRTCSNSFSGGFVGFSADGTAKVGSAAISCSIAWADGTSSICHYNQELSLGNGFVLYSRDYDTETKNSISAINVVVKPSASQLSTSGRVSCTVVSTSVSASCAIPSGCFVLSCAASSPYSSALSRISSLQPGSSFTVVTSCASGWENLSYICSGGELLVSGGKALSGFKLDSAGSRTARTAVGVRSDGSVVLYTVDGKQSKSAGITLSELAARLVELGCVSAVNLDGGGSTTMGTVSASGSVSIVNSPSDGSQRKCANFIFLVYNVTGLSISASETRCLPGAAVSVTASGISSAGTSVPATPNTKITASAGSVSGGVFTAPSAAQDVTLTASDGSLSASCTISVVDPETISVTDASDGSAVTSLTLDPGESVDLNAAGLLDGSTLVGGDSCFAWTVTDGLGSISSAGVFTAAKCTSVMTGTITVSCGFVTAEIPVTVEGGVQFISPLWDFESTVPSSGTGISVSRSSSTVRYGSGSAALSWSLSGSGNAVCSMTAMLNDEARRLSFWVKGDGSGRQLSLRLSQNGEEFLLPAVSLTSSDWQYVTVKLPEGEKTLLGFAVSGNAGSGTIYIDQCVLSRFAFSDQAGPAISTSVSGNTLTFSLSDSGSGVSSYSVTCDHGAAASVSSGSSHSVSIPQDGAAHEFLITAQDSAGNLSSVSVLTAGNSGVSFADTVGHWSEKSVCYMASQGILTGSSSSDGTLYYRPDDSMTRQEFVTALIRWLGVDTSQYSSTELPFADADSISSWALPACRAAYAMGLLSGSRGSNGKLYMQPGASVTRQEAMVLLGRTQQHGYGQDPLTSFSDAGRVGSWAKSYIAEMVTRGIISGSNGKLLPESPVTRAQAAKMFCSLY